MHPPAAASALGLPRLSTFVVGSSGEASAKAGHAVKSRWHLIPWAAVVAVIMLLSGLCIFVTCDAIAGSKGSEIYSLLTSSASYGGVYFKTYWFSVAFSIVLVAAALCAVYLLLAYETELEWRRHGLVTTSGQPASPVLERWGPKGFKIYAYTLLVVMILAQIWFTLLIAAEWQVIDTARSLRDTCSVPGKRAAEAAAVRDTIAANEDAIAALLNATFPAWTPTAVESLICSSLVCVDLMAFQIISRDDCECNAEVLAQVTVLADQAADIYVIGLVGLGLLLGGSLLLSLRCMSAMATVAMEVANREYMQPLLVGDMSQAMSQGNIGKRRGSGETPGGVAHLSPATLQRLSAQVAAGDPRTPGHARAAAALASYFPELDKVSEGSAGDVGDLEPEQPATQVLPQAVLPPSEPPPAQRAQRGRAQAHAVPAGEAATPAAAPAKHTGGKSQVEVDRVKVLDARPGPSPFAHAHPSPKTPAPVTAERVAPPPGRLVLTPAATFPRTRPDIERPVSPPASPFTVTTGAGRSLKEAHSIAEVGAAMALRHPPPPPQGVQPPHTHKHTHTIGEPASHTPPGRTFAAAYSMPQPETPFVARHYQPAAPATRTPVSVTRASAGGGQLRRGDRRDTAVASAAAGFLAALHDPEKRRAAREQLAWDKAEAEAQAARERQRNPHLHWGGSDDSD